MAIIKSGSTVGGLPIASTTGIETLTNKLVYNLLSGNIQSATTTDLATATGNTVNITGVNTITSFGTVQAGAIFNLVFTGVLTITHNNTSLILPGGTNITTIAGDVATFVSLGSGNWRCISYLVNKSI